MKREQITQQNYIDWLKSMGCVFYAPLVENDIKDYISGSQLEQSNGIITYDNNENAYRFNGPYSTNQYVGLWGNLSLNIDINNFGGSWMCEIKSGVSYTIPFCFGGRQFAQNIGGGKTNQWFKWATTLPSADGINNRYQFWYVNGEKANYPNGYNRGVNPTVFTPIAKQQIECNNIGNYSVYTNQTYFMRNVMIFNRALTQSEIKEIQGIL